MNKAARGSWLPLGFCMAFCGRPFSGEFHRYRGVISSQLYTYIYYSGCDWWISLLHHRWYGKWQVKSQEVYVCKVLTLPSQLPNKTLFFSSMNTCNYISRSHLWWPEGISYVQVCSGPGRKIHWNDVKRFSTLCFPNEGFPMASSSSRRKCVEVPHRVRISQNLEHFQFWCSIQ